MLVQYYLFEHSVVVSWGTVTHTFHKDDKRYPVVLECIANKTLEVIPSLVIEDTGAADRIKNALTRKRN